MAATVDRQARQSAKRAIKRGARATRHNDAGEATFNEWLDHNLRQLFQVDLEEPLPDEMLRLIRQI
ncbi:MAG: hypothetical protein HY246_01800 [Proteobacteria bacterium]|nr:hypothetical protein [Pseudomonadota bacterium]